jgi:hypothetical protein
VLDPNIKLFWTSQPTPVLASQSEADKFERSMSTNPAFDSDAPCIESFAKALTAILAEARLREMDAVTDLRSDYDGKPTADNTLFECTGYSRVTVRLNAAFGLTPEGAALAEKARTDPTIVVPQAFKRTSPPRPNALFLPLAPALANKKELAMQAPAVALYSGSTSPSGYTVEDSPDDFTRSRNIGTAGKEAACYEAVGDVLQRMIATARGDNYDAVVKIRSYRNGQPAPVATDFECEPGFFEATVTLIGSFAKAKPEESAKP